MKGLFLSVVRIYHYPQCSTCKDALKFLAHNRYAVDKIDIFVTPPSKAEIKKMLGFMNGNIKKLFNTTGRVYQDMNLAEKLSSMKEEEAIDLLAKNGKLIKRPFVLWEETGTVGYKKDDWKKIFKVD